MSNKKFTKQAEKIFEAHKNLEEVHVTSDGQGFTEKNKAEDHARILKDKTVELHKNASVAGNNDDSDNEGADAERDALVARYEELFGEKPKHNWKNETIEKKITDKEAEASQS